MIVVSQVMREHSWGTHAIYAENVTNALEFAVPVDDEDDLAMADRNQVGHPQLLPLFGCHNVVS